MKVPLIFIALFFCANCSYSQQDTVDLKTFSKKELIQKVEDQGEQVAQLILKVKNQNEAVLDIKKETEILRGIMKDYILVIDSLHTENVRLKLLLEESLGSE